MIEYSNHIYTHKRCYLVDWRTFPNNEVNWCAIVIKSAGLNQSLNPWSSTEFHDDNTEYPIGGGTECRDHLDLFCA